MHRRRISEGPPDRSVYCHYHAVQRPGNLAERVSPDLQMPRISAFNPCPNRSPSGPADSPLSILVIWDRASADELPADAAALCSWLAARHLEVAELVALAADEAVLRVAGGWPARPGQGAMSAAIACRHSASLIASRGPSTVGSSATRGPGGDVVCDHRRPRCGVVLFPGGPEPSSGGREPTVLASWRRW